MTLKFKKEIHYPSLICAVIFAFFSGGLGSEIISCWVSLSTGWVVFFNGIFSLIALGSGFYCLKYFIIRKMDETLEIRALNRVEIEDKLFKKDDRKK